MPNRSLIFLTILAAAAVAFAVVIVSGGGSSVQIGAPLLDRPIFSTVALEIEPADDAEPLRIERVGERWVIASDGWPANETAVRAALRLLGEVPVSAGGARPSDRETLVTLEFEGGEKAEFWIEPSARAVGGGAAVRDATGRQGRAPIDLARALETAKADTWRSLAAMPTVEIESSRVTIERVGEAPIALARVRGRWYLREPARAKADDRAVAALIGDLIDLRAIRFDGEATGQAASGISALIVERDERMPAADGSVSTRVARSELQALGPANEDGSESVVVSDGVRLVMRTDRLDALDVDPSLLVSRTAIAAAPGDIGMIVLRGPGGEIAFRRKVSEWDALGDAAARLADPTEESGGVERLLSFLSNAQAETVAIDPDRAGVVLLDRFIQIFGLGDEPIATLGVGERDAGGLVLFDEAQPEVVRTYSAGQTPPLFRAWLELP